MSPSVDQFKTTVQSAPPTALKAPQSAGPQTKVLQNRPIATPTAVKPNRGPEDQTAAVAGTLRRSNGA